MNHVTIDITDEDIDRALEDAKSRPPRPRALSAEYRADLNVLVLHLDTGRRLVLPREELQDLQHATPAQLAEIQIFSGVDIAFPQIDIDLYLPYLLEGRFGTEAWMQSLDRRSLAA